MTDLPDTVAAATIRTTRSDRAPDGYRLEETYWGYRIVPLGMAPFHLVMLQAVSLISGASFFAAAATLVVTADMADLLFRLPVYGPIAALGMALMWFASRGTLVQFEVDTLNGEVREVVRSRTGSTSVMARYGFDCIGSVFIQRKEGASARLVLRYRNTARTMVVALAEEQDLARLRDRMGRDLIVNRDHA